MPKITLEYADVDGVPCARFVTDWVEVTEDSRPTCYQYQ